MPTETRKYVLLTGSDLGERHELLAKASELIAQEIGHILKASEVLETEPWGFKSDTRFLNQAVLLETDKNPEDVLRCILTIEETLGRVRKETQWTSRTIDIDILCSKNLIHHSETLTIPHKHLHERLFALKPLCQVAAGWIHPLFNKRYEQLLNELETSELEPKIAL